MGTCTQLFDDYVKFHQIQIANRDVDPVYPVLREVAEILGWTPEERIRSVFLHVAYYDLGSALAALDGKSGAFLTAFTQPREGLACGTERRRHRMGDNLAVHLHHLDNIAIRYNGLSTWVQELITDDPVSNWTYVSTRLMEVDGNGRWSAFKTCEMLAEVCGMPLRAPDMGHANSSGPRQGLELLYPATQYLKGNRPGVIAALNVTSNLLVWELQARGAEASLETAETTLCDFHSLAEGRYYPGLDIDVMQEQVQRAPMNEWMRGIALAARRATLPEPYLGELHGRTGPDRARKRVYKLTGEIVTR